MSRKHTRPPRARPWEVAIPSIQTPASPVHWTMSDKTTETSAYHDALEKVMSVELVEPAVTPPDNRPPPWPPRSWWDMACYIMLAILVILVGITCGAMVGAVVWSS